jgi:hypothetical protein
MESQIHEVGATLFQILEFGNHIPTVGMIMSESMLNTVIIRLMAKDSEIYRNQGNNN